MGETLGNAPGVIITSFYNDMSPFVKNLSKQRWSFIDAIS